MLVLFECLFLKRWFLGDVVWRLGRGSIQKKVLYASDMKHVQMGQVNQNPFDMRVTNSLACMSHGYRYA